MARPRVWLFSLGPDPSSGTGYASTIDLALDEIMIADSGEDSASGADIAAARIWYGALETALETQFTIGRAAAIMPEGRRIVSLRPSHGRPSSASSDVTSLRRTAPAARSWRVESPARSP